MLGQVAKRLGPLREQMVFLGGATVGLFLTDSAAPPARATKDVDVIVEVASTMDYVTRLREALRAQGFSEDTTPGAPLCRWTADDIVRDVMPTSADVNRPEGARSRHLLRRYPVAHRHRARSFASA